jgi:hypothetical protein
LSQTCGDHCEVIGQTDGTVAKSHRRRKRNGRKRICEANSLSLVNLGKKFHVSIVFPQEDASKEATLQTEKHGGEMKGPSYRITKGNEVSSIYQ